MDRTDSVVIVTGGARGIGRSIVEKLLICNATVIIGCRNTVAGEEAVKNIRSKGISTGKTHVIQLNLMSFKSIKEFTEELEHKYNFINLLVNNAGIMFEPLKYSEDGFESHWQVNYLGPLYLTHLLFPLIEKGSERSEARIINVTSCAHKAAFFFNINNIQKNSSSDYIPSSAYAQSKLAQILFTFKLAKLIEEKNLKISTYVVHPGIVNTDLFNGTTFKKVFFWFLDKFCKTEEEGANSIVYVCNSSLLQEINGAYFSNYKRILASKKARNKDLQDFVFIKSLNDLSITSFFDKKV